MTVNDKLAFVFPGQGSQSVSMMGEFAGNPLVKSIFAEASEALGFDLLALVQDGPEGQLNKTENTQPALLTAGYCLWRLWQEAGGDAPAFVAGHSLGEYTALVCAGVMRFGDGVALVRDRGRYMQQAVPEGEGAMAAILGLDGDRLSQICAGFAKPQTVAAANFNSPEQTVIAGGKAAVTWAVNEAKSAGARRAVVLPVSVPSHCGLMAAAAEKLALRLEQVDFRDAAIPVVQNVDAKAHTAAAEIKQALVQQLHQPVQWLASIQALVGLGVSHIIECGPGKVLSGLIRRIDRNLLALPLGSPASLQAALEELS